MLGVVVAVFLTVISTGSWRYFADSRRIGAGMVAEKSATCLSSGVSARIVSTSSAKPMLSISSASSSTRNRSSVRSRVRRSRWSMIRPGVPTITCTPRRSATELDAVALAAVDRQHLHARHLRGVPLEGLADLERELAGGREDQRLRALLRQVEPGEDRQRERRGLAGAGLCEPDDVAALEERRDGRGLDRGGRLVAGGLHRGEDAVGEAEVGEALRVGVGHPSTVGGCRPPPDSSSRCGLRSPPTRR